MEFLNEFEMKFNATLMQFLSIDILEVFFIPTCLIEKHVLISEMRSSELTLQGERTVHRGCGIETAQLFCVPKGESKPHAVSKNFIYM